jgi:hypothetical protein
MKAIEAQRSRQLVVHKHQQAEHRGGASLKLRETKRGPEVQAGAKWVARLHLSRSAIFAGN